MAPDAAVLPAGKELDDECNSLSCRVCWERDDDENMLSPCACRGTQKHVHLKCLRLWQEALLKRNATDERAFRCSVCRSPFSVPPPSGRAGAVALQALRGLGGTLCIALLAFGLSGPPWPHLALLVLLLLASRSHWVPGLALLLTCSLLATMHARGLRVILRVDGGGRLGLALVRHGAPVHGVGPGVLLVASEGLDHSIFRRSVVLVTQHSRHGARGVILTSPVTSPPATGALPGDAGGAGGAPGARARLARRGGGGEPAVVLRHFLGGPVGMPGEGVNHEVLVLHTVPGVAGARRILPPANDSAAAPGGDAGLFEGGGVGEVLERAAAAAAAARARPRRAGRGRRAAEPAGGEGAPPVLLFHGVCAWAEGQLEGELRAGAWGFTADVAPSVLGLLSLPPDQLWQTLAGSSGLARVA